MHGNKTNKRKLISTLLLFAASAIIGLTGAVVIHKLSLENPIKTPTVTGEIEENNEGNFKNAVFKNTGEADVFLRVSYSETWSYPLDKETWILLPNEAICVKDGKEEKQAIANPVWNQKDWYKGSDGWWYYKYVLRSGQSTDELGEKLGFVTTVNFDNVNIAEDVRYKTAEYQLHFTMEVVQCSADYQVSQDAIDTVFGEGKVKLPETWSKEDSIEWTVSAPSASGSD